MIIWLGKSEVASSCSVAIAGSKSETNRLLLLQALFPSITLENISDSDDSVTMIDALQTRSDTIDIGHAGTAMRFLTAYFSTAEGRTVTLTGSERMKQRPIAVLVDALRELGAQIEYLGNDGFPPLKITGKKLEGDKISLRSDISSQYITALLLIAPKLENGLEITLVGNVTSRPYIEMTLSLLNEIGIQTSFDEQVIKVLPVHQPSIVSRKIVVESDWSSASYFYSIIALSEMGTQISLSTFKEETIQGDSALVEIYDELGVETIFAHGAIVLKKVVRVPSSVFRNLQNTPDLAQTIAVTCFGLGLECTLLGLQTLKIKETDRLESLRNELTKLGADVVVTDDSLILKASAGINPEVAIRTYDDHRMAMAFAPLALKVPVGIQDANVVSKSYPAFWDDLRSIGFTIKKG